MRHLGDLTKLKGDSVPLVDVITGGSPCFAAGSLVTTENGRIPIEDVKPGMVVLTHKKRWRTVKDCGCTGVKQTYELKGVGFETIKATGNHPFYASRKGGETKTAEWIQLKDLSKDCVLVGESNDDNESWFEIESIEKADVCDVYNLSVDEDESYCVNGIVVHNCQNLSVAGNRKGLGGDESRLFLEQVRLVKEMRDASKRMGVVCRPRYLVWENVKGAFSCNGGEDFRRVLEEIARVVEPDAVVPRPPQEKWSYSGVVLGNGWSIAWRLHDAQFWGVPQRRKRIALVADFGGQTAPEILFERGGVQGDSVPCGEEGKGSSGNLGEGVEGASASGGMTSYRFDQGAARDVGRLFIKESSKTLSNGTCPGHHNGVLTIKDEQDDSSCAGFGETGRGFWQPGIQTIRAEGENRPSRPSNVIVSNEKEEPVVLESNQNHATITNTGVSPTLSASMGLGGGFVPMVAENEKRERLAVDFHPQDDRYKITDTFQTIGANAGTGGNNVPVVLEKQTEEEPVVYDKTNITCPTNQSNPKPGDAAPTVHSMCGESIVVKKDEVWPNDVVGALCSND